MSASARLTWLGHSTVVVELDGTRIVTDPVFVVGSHTSAVTPRSSSPSGPMQSCYRIFTTTTSTLRR